MMLGEYLAFRYAKNVLLIDMDAQANLSYCMVPEASIQEQQRTGTTVYHLFRHALLGGRPDIQQYLTKPPLVVSNIARSSMNQPNTNIHMVVSTPSVAQLDEELLNMWEEGRTMPKRLRHALTEALEPVMDRYHYILIDCPPGLSLFSSTALMVSHYFVSPIIPEPLSLQGVELVKDRAQELKTREGSQVEFAGVILNIVKHYRNTHQRVSERLYTTEVEKYQPFRYWLPDNERIRKLGEFDPDEQGTWALGIDQKFPSIYAKYSLPYRLTNPSSGPLSRKDEEGSEYRLEERIARLVEEFQERCR